MPKMIDQETGEEREISMEEFLKAMQEGNITIRQDVHHADGSITSSNVYGNNIGDGIDRSLNIFAKMEDIFKVAVKKANTIKESDENEENIFRMDDSDVDYEVTIDDTSMPMMNIVKCTKEAVNISRYIRDERKSVSDPISVTEILFDNGKILATLEEIEEDNIALYAFGVYEIRQILRQRGILQKMQQLGNRSSGVIITLTSDNVINAKIVRGKARPELPCMMFGGIFDQDIEDAVMMRPYVDEIMGVPLYDNESLKDIIEAAEDGDEDAMETLATSYLQGNNNIEQNAEKAYYWFKRLAELENSVAMFNLGLLTAKGFGTKRNFDKAAEWMEKAAEYGDEDGGAIAKEYRSISKNISLAKKDDAEAQGHLAESYMILATSLDPAGPGKDYEESLKYAEEAIKNGCNVGYWVKALAYEHGRGVKANKKKAIEYYEMGAKAGHPGCIHSLGCKYFSGDELNENYKLGFELFKRSASLGYGLAMRDLGRCYQFGNGCVGNMKTAIKWYKKALKLINDPELERKVSFFETINDPGFDEEYPGEQSARKLTAEEQSFIDKIDSALSNEDCACAVAKPKKKERAAELEKYKANTVPLLEKYEDKYFDDVCAKVEKKRLNKKEKLIADEKERIEKVKTDLEKELKQATALYEKETKELDKQLSEKNAYLETLGIFAFSKKSEAKKEIGALNAKKLQISCKYGDTRKNIENKLKDNSIDEHKIEEDANEAYPMPERITVRTGFGYTKDMTAIQIAIVGTKCMMMDFFERNVGKWFTFTEIVENVPDLQDLTNQKISAFIRDLCKVGYIERKEENGNAYFSLVSQSIDESKILDQTSTLMNEPIWKSGAVTIEDIIRKTTVFRKFNEYEAVLYLKVMAKKELFVCYEKDGKLIFEKNIAGRAH